MEAKFAFELPFINKCRFLYKNQAKWA
jgi:hypothetical protein